MYIEVKKPNFQPVVIVLNSRREIEFLLTLLLLGKSDEKAEVNFINMFNKHNQLCLGSLPSLQEIDVATEQFGKLLATLNKELKR